MAGRRARWGCLYLPLTLILLVIVAVGFVFVQGRRTPTDTPIYVALGSSYAAGAGLGPLQPGSPLLCARSIDGYPQQLSRVLRLPIVDMSCGGAVIGNVLRGGQFFQGAQLRVVDPRTRLVTLTVGGNDIGYVGDLSMLALRHEGGIKGWLARHLWSGPRPSGRRDFARLDRELGEVLDVLQARAPGARIVVATYPRVLPVEGTCTRLGLTAAEADLMRPVGDTLARVTAEAVRRHGHGVLLVDMNTLGTGHDACAADAWTHGPAPLLEAPFHPTLAGARATAAAIARALGGVEAPATGAAR